MNYRRAVSVLLAVTAATMLVTGSFGFTSVSADRGVSVAVVDDENAYVSVSVCRKPSGNGKQNGNGANGVKVTVTNRFSESFRVAAISGDGRTVQPSKKTEIGPGDSETYPNAFGDREVTVSVVGGLDATVTVEVGDRCNDRRSKRGGKEETETPSATPTSTPTQTPTETPTATPTLTPQNTTATPTDA